MGNKNKHKHQPNTSPPKQVAPQQQPLPAPASQEQAQVQSLISKITGSFSEVLRMSPSEEQGAVGAPPAPEAVDLKALKEAWSQAEQSRHLWEKHSKRAEDEAHKHTERRKRLEEWERSLTERGKSLDEQKRAQEQKVKEDEARLKEERARLDKERGELLTWQKRLLDDEAGLLEREANAQAGFVEQQAAALAGLRESRARLETEIGALPARLEEVYATWVKEVQELQCRLAEGAGKARQELLLELAERRRQVDEELAARREQSTRELAAAREQALRAVQTERQELEELRARLEEQRKVQRQRQINLQAEQEELEDQRALLNELVERKAAGKVEGLKGELQSKVEELEESRRDRVQLQAKLRAHEQMNQRFGQLSPQEVLEKLRALEQEKLGLEQKLATRPSEQEKQRLLELETGQEQRALELARLKRENAELKARLENYTIAVTELQSLKSQKEAALKYNEFLQESLEVFERKVEGFIHHSKEQVAFPKCKDIDEDRGLQEEPELEERLPALKEFCEDLRQRLAYNEQQPVQRLYYSERDVRAFVAGLAMSRLHLLQGISGTGKTSLPREFARAVGGSSFLIEVQAGWRDRDDLLGHFNAFEGRYYESDFLQALYTTQTPAWRDRLCLIILDEMNLSRPEQYFANLLAQLEQPEAERVLRLTAGPNQQRPRLLLPGNVLKIPNNIWFVGTANHDETTVEFADKTYDRAHVMELPRQRQEFKVEPRPKRRPISLQALKGAFDQARKDYKDEAPKAIGLLEKHFSPTLEARFRVGWGNRLERQLADFLPVVRASGGTVVEAVDHLVATKLLRKIRGRHETRPEDLDELEKAVRTTFKHLGQEEPERSLQVIQDERRQPRTQDESERDAA